jgi:hypothetical protein
MHRLTLARVNKIWKKYIKGHKNGMQYSVVSVSKYLNFLIFFQHIIYNDNLKNQNIPSKIY